MDTTIKLNTAQILDYNQLFDKILIQIETDPRTFKIPFEHLPNFTQHP